MQKKKFSLTQLIFMALMAAVMCIAGPLAVPIGPVPITLTNLVIYIAVGVLGTAQGTISYCLYLIWEWSVFRFSQAMPVDLANLPDRQADI